MNEKRRNQARRFAIVAAICCTATTAPADQPRSTKSDSESIRRFLIEGLQPNIDSLSKVETGSTPAAVKMLAVPMPAAKPSMVGAPAIAPEQAKSSVDARAKASPTSLAEILRSKPRTIPVPKATPDVASDVAIKELSQASPAISDPVEPPKKQATTISSLIPTKSDSRAVVAAADRFDLPSDAPEPASAAPALEAIKAKAAAMVADDPQPTLADEKVSYKKALQRSERFHPAGEVPVAAASPVVFPAPTMSEMIEADTELRSMYQAEASFGLSNSSPDSQPWLLAVPAQTSAPTDPSTMEPIAPPATASATAAASTRTAEPLTASPAAMSPESAIHSHRLRELAHVAAQNAKQSLQRGATHSARRHATEALRLTVEMQDAATGNNEHARSLTTALDAIRESKDFCGQYGSVDARALSRMVAVHETSVLKDADLETMSGLQATEAYLKIAKEALVESAGGSNDACDALVMLGVIEKRMGGDNDPHAGAVAMTMHRAAIEISDANPVAYRELGNTFMSQGMYAQAAWSFDRSVRLRPSRSAYQNLLDASRKLGDSDTSRRCLAALKDPSLPSGIAVKTLAPDAFAASYRPNPSAMPARKASDTKPAPKPQPEPTRVTNRSLFGFDRR